MNRRGGYGLIAIGLTLAVAGVAAAQTFAPPPPGTTPLTPSTQPASPPPRAYVRRVPDRATFNAYSRVVGSDRFGKFIIDIRSNSIYFIDVNLFRLHADFVLGVLLKQEWTAENIRNYNRNYEREKPRFILGYLTEHLKIGKLTFAFWEGDKIDAKTIVKVQGRLNKDFFSKDMAFRPDSPAQEKVAKQVARLGVPVITNDQIYKAAPYQALNSGKAVGKLKVVPRGTPYESLLFDRSDIVLLQEAYPDISPVAGILSTESSTPLAHVNLRARAWDIPNASFNQARKQYAALHGKIVYYEVNEASHILREATREEIAHLRKANGKRRRVPVPPADLSTARLAMLDHISVDEASTFGAKTSNLGEIASARIAEVNVPPGFGIPFYYYAQHMKSHGIDAQLRAAMTDPRWKQATWRKPALEKIRKTIRDAPIDPGLLDAVYKRVRLKLGGRGVFVRSSTNVEDLEGFNGAGLYDTVPNVRGKQQLGQAIKQVWASLWNYRAVEERELFGIDHADAFAGVLVQVGVNASAAGVLITRNLYDPSDENSFTINAKWGLGIRVVQGTKVPEQIVFDTSNSGTKIISRSDDPVMLVFDKDGGIREVPTEGRGVILSEERSKRLADSVQAFMHLFPSTYDLDVEWLFEGEKVWIVQSRPYVDGRRQ